MKANKALSQKQSFLAGIKHRMSRILKYFPIICSELKKVSWPAHIDVKNNTLVVLAVAFLAVILLIILDTLFGGAMRLIVGSGF